MTIIELLALLRDHDIRITADGDQLRINAPKGALTPTLRAELAARKAELLAFLREMRSDSRAALPPIQPVPRDAPLPLSFGQQRLWFVHQLAPQQPLHNMPFALRLRGQLDCAALERSLNGLIQRHEVLRTTFAAVEGQPVQLIQPTLRLSLPIVEVAAGDQQAREARVQQLSAEEARRPFDLLRGPLLRATLLRLGPDGARDEHVLLIVMHHIVSDGWSISIFIREVGALYAAAIGQPSAETVLPPLPVQYADFAVWQRRSLRPAVLETQLPYWRQQLSGAPSVLTIEGDRPRPEAQSFAQGQPGAKQLLVLDPALTRALETLSQREGVTLFMTILAVFKTLLQHYTGQTDIVIGSPVANRTRVETEGLIGFFVNMLVLRTDLSGDPTFRELLHRVRQVTLQAHAHQDLSFEDLVAALQPKRDPRFTPLFQVVLAFQNIAMPALALPGLHLESAAIDNGIAAYDLHLAITEEPTGLTGTLTYNASLFEAATISRLLARFQTLLEQIVAQPETRLHSFEIIPTHERRRSTMEQSNRDELERPKFSRVKRKAIGPAADELVKFGYLTPGQSLPLVIQPAVPDVDLLAWTRSNLSLIEAELFKHGAILFHGFPVSSKEEFSEFMQAVAPSTLNYHEPSTPRTQVGSKIYTSTEYPADQVIRLHNEVSYAQSWPLKIAFFCVTAAKEGGETPIADSRKVLRRLPPELVERFRQRQVMYVRNFGGGLGLPWQTVFKTEDRAEVERYCRSAGIEFEWQEGDRLRTRQVRPAIASHPKTGDEIWFNQVNVHHVLSLEPSLREALLAVSPDKDFPLDMNACFGDGTPISADELAAIHTAYDAETIGFPWQEGDIMLVENMLVAHGRGTFVGPRKIVVMMAEPYSASDTPSAAEATALA